jgi:D-alanine-D-alanine ligase-like ATP-grasp enzyme
VIPSREFYDYEAKYIDDGSKIIIPRSWMPGRR